MYGGVDFDRYWSASAGTEGNCLLTKTELPYMTQSSFLHER